MVHNRHKVRAEPKIIARGEPRYRARKGLRRIARKTPGGRVVIHYVKKSPGKPKCAICGAVLHGLKRGTPKQIKSLSKTERTIQRPFGGMLCSSCTRDVLKLRVRLANGLIKPEEIPLSLKQYVIGG
jgi:large subunit ribosomal protein L34e